MKHIEFYRCSICDRDFKTADECRKHERYCGNPESGLIDPTEMQKLLEACRMQQEDERIRSKIALSKINGSPIYGSSPI